MQSYFIYSIFFLGSFVFTAQYFAFYGEIYSARVTGDYVDGFDPVNLLIIFFNGVANVDVYVACGVYGLCVSHSTGGEGFSDDANAL